MMKKFILVVCGSFVGVTLSLMLFTIASVIISFAIMASMGASSAAKPIGDNSILHITLDGDIPERDGAGDFDLMSIVSNGGDIQQPGASLATLKQAIEYAADNDKIKGIYLECNGADAAPATLYELRKALEQFKKGSKKFIYAYSKGYAQMDYYVATVADSIFVNPIGEVDLHGIAAVQSSYKGLLDKLDVKMQVLRVGTFKSAVEPYILDSISPANRMQQMHYLGSIWKDMSGAMATSRSIAPEKFQALADTLLCALPTEFLKANKIVDGTCYESEMKSRLRKTVNANEGDDIPFVEPKDMAAAGEPKHNGKSEIAVLYAVGEIDGKRGGIQSKDLIEQIEELQNDDDVAGMVLRVNSPGGSAYGSEQIWKALEDFKASGKPLAVSMGDYAASGGYYISSGADRIFAEPTTITGSIGIFGMIPCIEGLANKFGVRFSVVKTNKNAEFGTMCLPLTASQTAQMQAMINRGYELFTQRCATGRHVSQDSIKKIAEGRVWEGRTAIKIGLVDEFGGIDEAVAYVASKAKLGKSDYHVSIYPEPKTDWKQMLMQLGTNQAEEKLKQEMGMFYTSYSQLEAILNRDHVLCLMPEFEIR